MRNSSLLKWANNKNSKLSSGANGANGKKDEKKWIHQPDTLVQGHVVYLVKFLGNTKVDQPKGIEVVKQGIQKLKFNQQLKKSENGNKTPKVELTISVDGVTIQEPKTKNLLHQYPLHRISYCADDKAEKRFFSFIAKEGEGNGENLEHTCFVFVSDKLAEEITLTIGQAFELAYKKFLDTSGKEMETKKQLLVLQKRIALLETENGELKKRLKDVANIKGRQDVVEYMHRHDIAEITEVKQTATTTTAAVASSENNSNKKTTEVKPKPAASAPAAVTSSSAADELICLDSSVAESPSTSAMDKFTLDDLNDDDFNPRAGGGSEEDDDEDDLSPPQTQAPQPPAPSILPPPSQQQAASSSSSSSAADIFARKPDPFGDCDPFGMANFNDAPGKGAAAFADSFQNRQQAPPPAASSSATFSFEDLDPLKK